MSQRPFTLTPMGRRKFLATRAHGPLRRDGAVGPAAAAQRQAEPGRFTHKTPAALAAASASSQRTAVPRPVRTIKQVKDTLTPC